MRLRRLFESIDDESIKKWMRSHCLGGPYNLNYEIKPEGVEFTSSVKFTIPSPEDVPTFKILHVKDVTFIKCQISDFSFLPEITGELSFEDCTFSQVKGLPKKIKGNLLFKECYELESLDGIETNVSGIVTLLDVPKFSKFGNHKVEIMGSGFIVRGTGLLSLENMPIMPNVGYLHVSSSKIENLIGLPEELKILYVSSCPLQSIEGIPFVITEGETALSVSCAGACLKEKVFKQLDLYRELVSTLPPQPNEDRQSYIKRILEKNPTYSTLIPNSEIPREFSGGILLKKFGLF